MAKSYRPLAVPTGVNVKVESGQVTVKGKLGTLSVPVMSGLTVKVADGLVTVDSETGVPRAHTGSLRAHLGNAFVGVTDGYKVVLELRGMGYKAQKTKDGVQVSCGFSHPVDFRAPAGVTMDVSQAPDPDDTKLQMFEILVAGLTDTQWASSPPLSTGQSHRTCIGERASGTRVSTCARSRASARPAPRLLKFVPSAIVAGADWRCLTSA